MILMPMVGLLKFSNQGGAQVTGKDHTGSHLEALLGPRVKRRFFIQAVLRLS